MIPEGWLTSEEVAEQFGITPASVRGNFPRQYGIRPQNDMWRASDIRKVWLARKQKGLAA